MKQRNRQKRALALALALLAPLPLLAAGSATLANGSEVNTLAWQDAQTVRMDLSTEDGYMLLRDGKVYMVNPQATGGMPPVMEVGSMMQGMVEAFADDDSAASPLSHRIESIRSTGKKETVAGITGEVHDVVFTDDQGKTDSTQMVLTGDPLAVEMTEAYVALTGAMLGPERMAEFRDALPKARRGLLRVGDDLVVQAIGKEAPEAEAFELPAEPMNMGDMMKELMKQMQQPSQ